MARGAWLRAGELQQPVRRRQRRRAQGRPYLRLHRSAEHGRSLCRWSPRRAGPASRRPAPHRHAECGERPGGWLPIAFHEVRGHGAPEKCLADAHSVEAEVLARFAAWLRDRAPAGVTVERVRDVMGAPEQPPLPPRETVVSLTFDDALASQYGLRPTLASVSKPPSTSRPGRWTAVGRAV